MFYKFFVNFVPFVVSQIKGLTKNFFEMASIIASLYSVAGRLSEKNKPPRCR